MRINPNTWASGRIVIAHQPRRRQKIVAFRIDSTFNGRSTECDITLDIRKSMIQRDKQLRLNNIHPGDQFTHRVLNLQSGVHFYKMELALGI